VGLEVGDSVEGVPDRRIVLDGSLTNCRVGSTACAGHEHGSRMTTLAATL
jgi:hypothetical protein